MNELKIKYCEVMICVNKSVRIRVVNNNNQNIQHNNNNNRNILF